MITAVSDAATCAGCIEECVPEHCAKLSEWIFAIVIGGEGGAEFEDDEGILGGPS